MKKIFLSAILMLSACCDGDDKDCTPQELVDKRAVQDGSVQLVSTQDNIKLYRVWTHEPRASSHWTYFTTPCGDISSQIEYRTGKTTNTIPQTINGTGCK